MTHVCNCCGEYVDDIEECDVIPHKVGDEVEHGVQCPGCGSLNTLQWFGDEVVASEDDEWEDEDPDNEDW